MRNNKRLTMIIIFTFMIMGSKFLSAQSRNGFSIEGNIRGLKEGEKVFLMMVNTNGLDEEFFDGMIRTDSAYVKNGKFSIEGYVPDGPRAYTMSFDGHMHKFIELYIDNGERIKIDADDLNSIQHSYVQHYVKVEGSLTHYGMMCLNPFLTFYMQSTSRLNGCIRKVKESVGFNGPAVEAFIKAKDELNNTLCYNFLIGGRDPEIAKSALFLSYPLFLRSGHSAIWPLVYDSLSNDEKTSFYGKLLKQKISLCIGQPFPDFSLPTPEGKTLALRDVVSNSKITIIHFWARNSVEKKRYQNELLNLYKKYHEKGLNIIGYSTDDYREDWTIGLRESNVPWYNVGEQKGLEGMAKKVYHEYSSDFYNNYLTHNTTNVVLDAEGKILAWDVNGAELQYYLWKALEEPKNEIK